MGGREGGRFREGTEAMGTMGRSVRDTRGGQEDNKLEPPGDAEDDRGDGEGEIVQAGDQWNEINKAVQEADMHARVCMGCRLAAGGGGGGAERGSGVGGAESSAGPPGDAGRPGLIHYE